MAKKHKGPSHDDDHIDETWLIPYADLLTLLLALFIVLFASSSLDAKKFEKMMVSFSEILTGGTSVLDESTPIGEPTIDSNKKALDDKNKLKQQSDQKQQSDTQKETVDLQKLKKQLDDYIKKNDLTSQLVTTLNTQQLTITIRDNALFASGSATVKEGARTLALAMSKMLQQYPQYEIIVAGHTDDRPINTAEFKSNWELSVARALNFMEVLLLNKEVNETRFSATGYGEHRPLKSNSTEEGRAANRRVEVSIIRNFQPTAPEVISTNK